jgi:hypothetical protein
MQFNQLFAAFHRTAQQARGMQLLPFPLPTVIHQVISKHIDSIYPPEDNYYIQV